MGDLVCMNKPKEVENDLIEVTATPETTSEGGQEAEAPASRAVVPTIDIYTARVLFNLTQKMVEETVDRRISLLEERIEDRDKEIMRTIRKMQARMIVHPGKIQVPWWRKLFQRGK